MTHESYDTNESTAESSDGTNRYKAKKNNYTDPCFCYFWKFQLERFIALVGYLFNNILSPTRNMKGVYNFINIAGRSHIYRVIKVNKTEMIGKNDFTNYIYIYICISRILSAIPNIVTEKYVILPQQYWLFCWCQHLCNQSKLWFEFTVFW